MSDASPPLSYWHLWTEESGTSRQANCTLSDFELKGVGWIVVLFGGIESMDRTRVERHAGDFSLGADQHCRRDAQGRLGHRSGTIGDQPAVLVCVRLQDPPPPGLASGSGAFR